MPLNSKEILATLQQEPSPLTFPKLKKIFVSKKSGVTEADLRAALAGEGIFAWTKPKNSYWHIDPALWLENQIVAQCGRKAIDKVVLKGPAKKELDGAVAKLLAEGKIIRYPAIEGKKTVLVAAAGAREAYWAYVRDTIEAKLMKAGIAEEAGLDEKIWDILPKLEPERDVPVSTARVRSALGLGENDKHRFDEAVLRLREQRKVYLSQHDHALAVSKEERDLLIEGKDGRYYVAITRREQ
jgi:hypothetical protein